MRTKVLLCLAALAAGVATSSAQVYSLNVVGYVNIPVPANQYVLIANQLNNSPDNTLATLLPSPVDGTILQKFSAGYQGYIYDASVPGWVPDGNATLNPGEGAFVKSPTATTLTFVGEVLQGSRTNTLPIGAYALRSSIVPQAGTPTLFNLPAEDGDILQTFHAGYQGYIYDASVPGWVPSEPNLAVGDAFFYKKSPAGTSSQWIRSFTVQ